MQAHIQSAKLLQLFPAIYSGLIQLKLPLSFHLGHYLKASMSESTHNYPERHEFRHPSDPCWPHCQGGVFTLVIYLCRQLETLWGIRHYEFWSEGKINLYEYREITLPPHDERHRARAKKFHQFWSLGLWSFGLVFCLSGFFKYCG